MRRLGRDLVSYGVILLLLAGLGGFAWLTWNPDAAIVARAEEWPGVGPLARAFRERYGVAVPSAPEAVALDAPAAAILAPEPEILGLLSLPAEVTLHARPDAASEVRARTARRAPAALLEDRETWLRVRVGGAEGWVSNEDLAARLPGGAEPGPRPPLPLPAVDPSPEHLERARSLFRQPPREGWLGPYRLLTDVGDEELLASLAARAEKIERGYRRRYRLRPLGEPKETVILFRHEIDYRAFMGSLLDGAEFEGVAQTALGTVALLSGDRPSSEVGSTLVHEIGHLLNRRALGPVLPPWLDEGIASDLAYSAVRVDGALLPGTVGGTVRLAASGVEYSGGRAALVEALRALQEDRLLPLERLVGLHRDEFLASEARELAYPQSAFFVRYLLEPGEASRRDAFLGFLESVAAGGPSGPEALRARLEVGFEELDTGFRRWLRWEGRKLQGALETLFPDVRFEKFGDTNPISK